MRKLLFSIAIAFLYGATLSAQCPTSNRTGIHVVQYGQTLFRISKLYNVTIDDLREWNGMQFNELLSVCQELRIVPSASSTVSSTSTTAVPTRQDVFVTRTPTTVQTATVVNKPYSNYRKQTGGRHVVQQGETVANLAKLYGYSEARFREFNVLRAGQEPVTGSVLLSTDCACNRASYSAHANGLFNGQWNDRLITHSEDGFYHKKYDNSMAATTTPPPTYTPPQTNYNTTPSYNNTPPNYTPPPYNQPSQGAATSWGNVRITRPPSTNGQPTNTTSSTDNWRRNQGTTTATTNDNSGWRRGQTSSYNQPSTYNQPATTTNRTTINPNAYNNERAAATYMTNEELDMIDEINVVRSNPAGYVRYVEQYIQDIRSGKAFGSSTTAAYELIDELKRTGPLSVLKPVECLYRAAQNHGQEAVKKGSSDHQGLDGSWPWDRAMRSCSQMTDGNENLVGGPSSIREAVMLLLVDDGISNRGHRKTLLQKDWKYVACYKSGMVGRMPNSWVQMFGK